MAAAAEDMPASGASTAATHEAFAALSCAQQRFGPQLLQRFAAVPAAGELFQALLAGLARDPEPVQAIHARFYAEQLALWAHFARPSVARPLPPFATDARFAAPPWELPWFDYLRRAYALQARWLVALIDCADVEPAQRRRLHFCARQFLDAVAPSNVVATNPEALARAFATGGESFAQGLRNLAADAAKGRVSMSDEQAFEVGRNLAVTPGAVVYRNELIELLHYQPSTATVHRRPLLIVPPCINKYYVLDLRPENSFVRFARDQGLQVFMISWRDIPPELAHLTWDDYIERGVAEALAATRRLSGASKLNVLGFCVGGTLLASALAVAAGKRRRPAASLTLVASLLDYADPGEIGVYVDRDYVEVCEREAGTGTLVPGSRLADAFASLRANELVWRYVVESYLKGLTPPAFDLLYWNADSANLPGPMYAYYLRHMYRENALRRPDALRMCGVPVDLSRIALPSYVFAAESDHIVPWRSAYASARLLGEDVAFVLGGSGHIAGVVNPPHPPRRHYRTGPFESPDPQHFLRHAQRHAGSWWGHWFDWLRRRSGARIPATAVSKLLQDAAVEPAPGRYVRAAGKTAPAPAALP
jgi:polyhydroxyalkanoate synthase